jgi:hypothetical protein
MNSNEHLPFVEKEIAKSVFTRTFSCDTDEMDLKWHWDEEDRTVTPIGETDWQFQFDNEIPFVINKQIFIPAGVIHRVIKGSGDLTIKVEKHETRPHV